MLIWLFCICYSTRLRQVACFFLHCRVQQLLLGAAVVEAPPSLPSRSSRARLGPKTLLLRKCSSETIFCAMSGSPTLPWPPLSWGHGSRRRLPGLGLKERVGSSEAEKAGKKARPLEWEAESCVAALSSIPLTQGQPCKANILKGRPSS